MRLRQLWQDERGVVVSAELVVISSVMVLGLVTGLSAVREKCVGEFENLGAAIGSLDQSYYFAGPHSFRDPCGRCGAWVAGSSYSDWKCRCRDCCPSDCFGECEGCPAAGDCRRGCGRNRCLHPQTESLQPPDPEGPQLEPLPAPEEPRQPSEERPPAPPLPEGARSRELPDYSELVPVLPKNRDDLPQAKLEPSLHDDFPTPTLFVPSALK